MSARLVARPDGPISDGADIIAAPDEIMLAKRLRGVFDQTQTGLVVVTVRSLRGEDVAGFANALARQWEIGGKRGGVVLLVAPNERQLRIETSDTVRERLSDRQCAEIIQRVITPRFRSGDFSGGIVEGVEAIATYL